MSKRDNNRVVFADFKARKEDEGATDIEMPNGLIVHVPPADLWSDEAIKMVTSGNRDVVALARAVLGDELYDQFVDAGGTAAALNSILEERHGATVGESAASSSS